MGQLIFEGVGAVVGGVLGGPGGAAVGLSVGGLIGGLLFPQRTPIHMQQVHVQGSSYGAPIPWCYGQIRVSGNVIWAGQPVQHTQSHGKGFMTPSASTQDVNMSFAVAICEGPIVGLQRMWANGKLIYDVSNPSDFAQLSGSTAMVTNFNLYLGTESQLPDPIMEAALGVGNVPAHRGMAYIVFNNLALYDYGNALPNLSFEVLQNSTVSYSNTIIESFYSSALTSYGQCTITSITPSGGLGWESGNNLSEGYSWVPFQMTPYGAQATGASYVSPGVETIPASSCVDLTGAGMYLSCPYFSYGCRVLNPSTPGYLVIQLNAGSLGLSDQVTSVFIGSMVFTSDPTRSGGPLGSYDFDNETYNTSTYNFQGCYVYTMGATNDYVYVYCQLGPEGSTINGHVLRFDYNLNFIADLGAPTNGCQAMWVVNDNEIYVSSVAANIGMWNGAEWVLTTIGNTGLSGVNAMLVQGGINYQSTGEAAQAFVVCAPSYGNPGVTLESVINDICTRAGLVEGQYDASQCQDLVQGYVVTETATARDALDPLLQLYYTDVSDTDGLLKFVRRGAQPIVTMPYAVLGAATTAAGSETQNPLSINSTQEIDLPKRLTLSYYGVNYDYNTQTQTAYRTQTYSNYLSNVQAAIALNDAQALSCAQTLLYAAWANMYAFSFNTDMSYAAYEPGDNVVVVDSDGTAYTVRLTKCNYDGIGVLKWSGVSEVPTLYPNAGVVPSLSSGIPAGYKPQTLQYSGATVVWPLDVSPLTNAATSQGVYLAACGYAASWPGCSIQSSTDGSNFTTVTSAPTPAVMGLTTAAPGAWHGGNQPDELNSITVKLLDPALELSSVTYANFLNNESVAYVGGEIIAFRNAELVSAGVYTLSGFIRGLQGTEAYMNSHVAGEQFVFLDNNVVSLGILVAQIDAPMYFEATTVSVAANDNGPVSITPVNARVRPLSPVFVSAWQDATQEVNISWLRRARVNNQWLDGTDVPLDEASEGYTITATDGSGRTWWTYSFTQTFAPGTVPNAIWPATTLTTGMTGVPASEVPSGTHITVQVQQHSDQGILGVPGYAPSITI